MNRAAEVAASMVRKLFPKPPDKQVERHLSRDQVSEIVKAAYEIGHRDGLAGNAPIKCACGKPAIQEAKPVDRLSFEGFMKGQCYACAGATT